MVSQKWWYILPEVSIKGDPLSPLLFLLCTEGLHSLITNARNFGKIKGFSFCKKGPKLTHLLFADDNLFFFFFFFVGPLLMNVQRCLISWRQMNLHLDIRSIGVRQLRSLVSLLQRMYIKPLKEVWACKKSLRLKNILACHFLLEERKKESFNYIKERVWKKLQGWEGKLLSQSGREVLIKLVIYPSNSNIHYGMLQATYWFM